MSMIMNPHELRFRAYGTRTSGRYTWPVGRSNGRRRRLSKVGSALGWRRLVRHIALMVSALFLAIFIVGVLRMKFPISAGRQIFPYYFLFKRSGTSSDTKRKIVGPGE